MFRWYTFVPLFLAAAARGASFLIGDSGISRPRTDISGIVTIYNLTIYNLTISVAKVLNIFEIVLFFDLIVYFCTKFLHRRIKL